MKLVNRKSDIAHTRELLLKQRAQYFDQNDYQIDIIVDRRSNNYGLRSISDRRTIIGPNQTDNSRRKTINDRRKTRFGRRESDLSLKPKIMEH